MARYLALDLVMIEGAPCTSTGTVDMSAALAMEPIDTEGGAPIHATHDWADVSLLAREGLTFEELQRAARLLLAQLGLLIERCAEEPSDRLISEAELADIHRLMRARWRQL